MKLKDSSIPIHGKLSIALLVGTFVGSIVAQPNSASAATLYDLKTDWSNTSNPNGPWSYKQGNTPLQAATWDFGGYWSTTQPGWAVTQTITTSSLPFWFKSNGSETLAKDWQAGDIVVHTTDPDNGVGNGVANVTWTSPIAGTIGITGNAWLGRAIGRSDDWEIYLNNTLLTKGSLFDGDPYDRANPFNFAAGSGGANILNNIAVNTGDVVKLQLVKTAPAGDFVGVNLAISATQSSTAVPEPFTIIGTLIGGTAAVRMRKKLRAAKLANAID
jgi:hypothetical protein